MQSRLYGLELRQIHCFYGYRLAWVGKQRKNEKYSRQSKFEKFRVEFCNGDFVAMRRDGQRHRQAGRP